MHLGIYYLLLSVIPSGGLAAAHVGGPQGGRTVGCTSSTFNPSKGDQFKCTLAGDWPPSSFLVVRDADWRPIRSLTLSRKGSAAYSVTWDGKDSAGMIVPDEAYTIAIMDRVRNRVLYDPATISGGEFGDVERIEVDRTRGTLSYSLSAPSRVLFRAGFKSADHLKTVVNLEPRPSGRIVEYWNGKDESGLVNLLGAPNCYLVISYYELPQNSVIAYGNRTLEYASYRPKPLSLTVPLPAITPSARRVSPLFLQRRSRARDFRLELLVDAESPPAPKAVVNARQGSLLRVSTNEATRKLLDGRQFEIMFYFDHQFFAESERGYLPFNMPLDTGTLTPGEHLLTVNITTYDGLSGLVSRKVRVEK